MKLNNFFYIFLFFFILSCSKKVENTTTLNEVNLETQMIEIYNQAME